MDKKLKFWNSFRKWILIGWILWILSIMYWFNTESEGVFDWSVGFSIACPALFFVLLFLTYYETNQIYDKEYNKDKKQDSTRTRCFINGFINNFVNIIKPAVIFCDILWILWLIIPNLNWSYCYNCGIWVHYFKILLLISNIYFLIGPGKINKWVLSFRKIIGIFKIK